MKNKETIRQTLNRHDIEINDLQEFKDRVGPEVRQANLRAKEAHVGFVETNVAQRFYEKQFDKLEKNIAGNTRLQWTVFFSVIALILSIIGAIVTLIKFIGGQ